MGARLVVMGEKDRVGALAEDLRDVRRRGLADIDVDVAGQPPLALSQLESLARRYARDSAEPRIELIRRLLHDVLQAYRVAGYQHDAQLLGLLFFDDGTGENLGHKPPRDLLDKAGEASGVSAATFDKRRPGIYRHFADYLIRFVERRKSPPGWRWPAILVAVAVVLALGITGALLVARHAGHTNTTPHQGGGLPTNSTSLDTAATSATTPSAASGATLTFDDLGGGSTVIRVFPGVHDTPSDLIQNGTYNSGDVVAAICKTTGRPVSSDPTVGERPRKSSEWVRIAASPGLQQYASLTYADISATALKSLVSCLDVP